MCAPEPLFTPRTALNMTKRILVVASWYPHEFFPAFGIFIRDQVEVLSRRYQLFVYVPQPVVWRALRSFRELPRRSLSTENGVPVFRDPILLPMRFAGPATMGLVYRGVRRRLDNLTAAWGRPDIIHAHVCLPGGWLASRIGQEWNVPVVLTEHTGRLSSQLRSPGQRDLMCQAVNGVQRVLAVSPALTDKMEGAFPGVRVGVLGNVIRTDFFTPGDPAHRDGGEDKVICTVALLSPGKGIQVLLRAAKILRERGQVRFRVMIGGDGPERGRLEQMAASYGLRGICQFTGMLRRNEVRTLLRSSDIFVLPSLGETFGVALGEAMACGKYVIATRSGGPEFVIAPGSGVLVDKDNASHLAEALEQVLTGTGGEFASHARESIDQRFGPDAFLRNVSAVYASL